MSMPDETVSRVYYVHFLCGDWACCSADYTFDENPPRARWDEIWVKHSMTIPSPPILECFYPVTFDLLDDAVSCMDYLAEKHTGQSFRVVEVVKTVVESRMANSEKESDPC